MKNRISFGVKALLLICLISWTSFPITDSNTGSGPALASPTQNLSAEGEGFIEGIPYVWQEMNGYCNIAAVSMALQHLGLDLDLHKIFAASGIGMSMAYVRIDDAMYIQSGTGFRQQQSLKMLEDLYGVESMIYLLRNAGQTNQTRDALMDWGLNVTVTDGYVDSMEVLKTTINEGYPLVVGVDTYYLPPFDYNLSRDYGAPQDPDAPISGHAILVTGYNDTDSTVQIMDPGVGAFGDSFGYPDDGRWSYSMNYSLFNSSWYALGYHAQVLKLDDGRVPDFETSLIQNVADKLLGDRDSYAPDAGDVFFATFGETAFRGMSLDFTIEGITNYLDEFNETESKATALARMGFATQASITLQYLAFRTAIKELPTIVPDLDISKFTEAAEEALPHMEILSQNDTMTDPFYMGSEDDLLVNTILDIYYSYDSSGDLETALGENQENIELIAGHLLAIADSWKAAGEALENALSDSSMLDGVGISVFGGIAVILVAIVVFRRRSR
ncbi:MAG: C39 family peptidase [Candidatus Thorarchaeota archaeon]